ncbi:MAG: DMT family transporter [Planctomycetes bacterium]|nr:DMT family transporter [Planctomycetota bacterium]
MSGTTPRGAPAVVALLCLIWGSTWLVIQGGLRDLPPLTALAGRFGIAALVLLLVAPHLHRLERGERPTWREVLFHGWLCSALPLGIVYVCELVIPSGLTSLIWGVYPLLVAGLSRVLLPEEKLRASQWLGFAGAFGGLCVLFATDLRDLGANAIAMAALLLLSPLSSATGTLLLKRRSHGTSSILLNRDGLCLAAATVGLAALLFEREAPVRWTSGALASVLYMGFVATVLAFTLYYWLLRTVPANQLALISYVTPLIALGLGACFAGEPLHLHTLVGAALILGGILAARRR